MRHRLFVGQGECELLRGQVQQCSLEQSGHLSKEGIQAIGNWMSPWCSNLTEPVTKGIVHDKLLVRQSFRSAPARAGQPGQCVIPISRL